jgi:hypothetical protein
VVAESATGKRLEDEMTQPNFDMPVTRIERDGEIHDYTSLDTTLRWIEQAREEHERGDGLLAWAISGWTCWLLAMVLMIWGRA